MMCLPPPAVHIMQFYADRSVTILWVCGRITQKLRSELLGLRTHLWRQMFCYGLHALRRSPTLVRHVCVNDERDPLETKINLNGIQGLSPYRAVNTLRLGYKTQSVNAV